MRKPSQFLFLTIALDLVFIVLISTLPLGGNQGLYRAVAILVVSPVLTYLIVYQLDLVGTIRKRTT